MLGRAWRRNEVRGSNPALASRVSRFAVQGGKAQGVHINPFPGNADNLIAWKTRFGACAGARYKWEVTAGNDFAEVSGCKAAERCQLFRLGLGLHADEPWEAPAG